MPPKPEKKADNSNRLVLKDSRASIGFIRDTFPHHFTV